MIDVAEIISFVNKQSDIKNIKILKYQKSKFDRVGGINNDKEATQGDIAWISAKHFRGNLNKVNNFKGSMLIIPEDISDDLSKINIDYTLIITSNPKLLFIRLANNFFSYLSKSEWSKSINFVIHEKAKIGNNVKIAHGVSIGSNVQINDNVTIGPNTIIDNTEIRKNVSIGANNSIGLMGFGYEKNTENIYELFPHFGRVLINENVEIGSNNCIDRGSLKNTIIGKGTKIDNLVHIAHNVKIGKNCMLIGQCQLAGSVQIGDNAWVAPSSSILNGIRIGKNVFIGLGSVVIKDVDDDMNVFGNPARVIKK